MTDKTLRGMVAELLTAIDRIQENPTDHSTQKRYREALAALRKEVKPAPEPGAAFRALACKTCKGSGQVVDDEDECMMACPRCNATGLAP